MKRHVSNWQKPNDRKKNKKNRKRKNNRNKNKTTLKIRETANRMKVERNPNKENRAKITTNRNNRKMVKTSLETATPNHNPEVQAKNKNWQINKPSVSLMN